MMGVSFYGIENHDEIHKATEVSNKLGRLEDLLENADSIRIIKRDGIASLHIDMILDVDTFLIANELFGKDKSE